MMRRQLLLCSAIAALLSSPAQAQYIDRYKTSERPPVEVNLDVLNERQEQEYHAQTDVAQEPLPVSQPPVMEAQAVEAMPEPAAPAQKRKLLKPVLTTPVAQEEAPEEETAAASNAKNTGITPDGEMPPTQTIVKHVIIKSYSPIDDMPVAQSAAVDEIYRQAAIEDVAASITPVEEPLPLPRRKPVMGEAKAEPVRMASLSKTTAAAPVIADDVPATQTAAAEQKDEPKIEVAATEVAPDVKAEEPEAAEEVPAPVVAEAKAEEPKAEEPKAAEPKTEEKQPEQAAAEPIPAPVQMAQADIPAPVTPQPARNRIISQPPRLKEQTLQPLLPRTAPAGKPIVSTPPDVGAATAPVRPSAPTVPKMTAQPVAPGATDPLPEAVPVAPVEQAAPAAPVAPVAAAPAPAAEPETPAQPRPSLEIVGAPLADVNAPSDPADAAMPVVPVIDDLTLNFPGNSSDLTGESQKKLDAVIQQMNGMIEGRLQVRGYAAGEDGSQSSARRIALSRALAVRSYMMDKGIKPTRVDVKAAGSETDRQPLDRVDLIFAR
ncbi:MAG: OmpA family protein [Alphaproteobacteria bacterium]|nr:OmpA family protein [Alphaproteobacteria bacterium]